MIKISDIKLGIDKILKKEDIAKQIGAKTEDIIDYKVILKSIDARKKPEIFYSYSVAANVKNEEKYVRSKKAESYICSDFDFPKNKVTSDKRVVIAGLGPAGLFAGLYLANAGIKPVIIERGEDVDKRIETVNRFWNTGVFNENSNVQFGEGGAGTFSDGKLTTGVNDERIDFIKRQFVKFGASEEILYQKKAHIGTDTLRTVVKNIRNELIRLGAEIRFGTQLIDIMINNKRITGITVQCNGNEENINTDNLILAIGHSARDTLQMLKRNNVPMERKTFSVGGRIEHLQSMIGMSQYGDIYDRLPPADYKLSVKTKDGRGVYTFCMCPGGYVVASAGQKGMVVTNGMSYYKRDGQNANSALLVTVNPEDIEGDDVLGGVLFQEKIERAAYKVGGSNYYAPVSLVGDFLNNKVSEKFGRILPTYKPGTKFADLYDVLPEFIADSMKEAIILMDRRLKGFNTYDAIITIPETKSSSPVRIIRDKNTLQSDILGLYPCGEGAGYAGGIMSAALDGIRCATALYESIRN